MDRGELFKQQFRIEPAANSGFILTAYPPRVDGARVEPVIYAFSNLDDLFRWLNDQRPENAKQQGALTYGILGGSAAVNTFPQAT